MSTNIYFEIQADEPERAVNFYKQVFDWKFAKDASLPVLKKVLRLAAKSPELVGVN